MDTANSLLTIICSCLTIVAAVVGCFLFFYNKLTDQIKDVKSDVEKTESSARERFDKLLASIIALEKDMLKGSDDRLKRLIAKVSRRVDDVDEVYLKKHRDARNEIEQVRANLSEAKTMMESIVKQSQPASALHLKVEQLGIRDTQTRRAVVAVQKVVKDHQEWLSELRRRDKGGKS